jgi:hypothetical protein
VAELPLQVVDRASPAPQVFDGEQAAGIVVAEQLKLRAVLCRFASHAPHQTADPGGDLLHALALPFPEHPRLADEARLPVQDRLSRRRQRHRADLVALACSTVIMRSGD